MQIGLDVTIAWPNCKRSLFLKTSAKQTHTFLWPSKALKSGIGIEDGGSTAGLVYNYKITCLDRVEVRFFGTGYSGTARRASLIDGESCPAWKYAFLLPFTDSRRPNTLRKGRRRGRLFLSFSDPTIGTVRAGSLEVPVGETPDVNTDRPLNPESRIFTLSSYGQIKLMMFRKICFRSSLGIRKSREESGRAEFDEILGFRQPTIIDLRTLRKRGRERKKKITTRVFATRGKFVSNSLLHAGSMSFYPQLQALQGRSDYVHQDCFNISRYAGRSCIPSPRPIVLQLHTGIISSLYAIVLQLYCLIVPRIRWSVQVLGLNKSWYFDP